MGREMSCSAVRRSCRTATGAPPRARRLRGHLRSCEDCRRFRDALRTRRSELALIAPALPAATAADVLESVIGAGGIGGGGLLAGLLGGGGAAKVVAVGAATVTAGAGAVTYTAVGPDEERRERAARTVERDDAGTAAPRVRKAPAVVDAVATRGGGDRDRGDAGPPRVDARCAGSRGRRRPRRARPRLAAARA